MQTMDVLIALLKPKQDAARYSQQQADPASNSQSPWADASASAAAELDGSIKQATVQVSRHLYKRLTFYCPMSA